MRRKRRVGKREICAAACQLQLGLGLLRKKKEEESLQFQVASCSARVVFFAVLVLLEMEKDQRKGVVVFHKSPSNYYSLRQKK